MSASNKPLDICDLCGGPVLSGDGRLERLRLPSGGRANQASLLCPTCSAEVNSHGMVKADSPTVTGNPGDV